MLLKKYINIWHKQFAHQNINQVKTILNDFKIIRDSKNKVDFCESCATAKVYRLLVESKFYKNFSHWGINSY